MISDSDRRLIHATAQSRDLNVEQRIAIYQEIWGRSAPPPLFKRLLRWLRSSP